jgi:hypothetical protein
MEALSATASKQPTCCPCRTGRDVLSVVEVSLVKIRNKNIKIRNKSEIQILNAQNKRYFVDLNSFPPE